jgi:hypothetical protein
MPLAKSAVPAIAPYDPRREILDKIGDVSWYKIANNEVLTAIYIRPETTAGGIILTSNTRKEDKYQGKVHLVLKIGDACRFVRTEGDVTYGIDVKLHDWIVGNPSHGWALDISSGPDYNDAKSFVPCRKFFDDGIRAVIDNPQKIW